MELVQILLVATIAVPLIASGYEATNGENGNRIFSKWICLSGSILPFLVCVGLGIFIADHGGYISVSIPFLSVLDLSWSFSANVASMAILSIILLCFILAQLIGGLETNPRLVSYGLVLLLQACITTIVLSRNLLSFAHIQILSGFVLFLIYKNSLRDNRGEDHVRAWAAERFLGLQVLSGITVIAIVTSIAGVFGDSIFDFENFRQQLPMILQNEAFKHLSLYFLIPFLLVLPVIPWSHWFAPLFEHRKISPALNIIMSSYVAVIAFVYFDIFYLVLGAQISEYKLVVPIVGLVLCFANLSFAIVEKSVRRKLSYMTAYLLAFSIYSLGSMDANSYYLGILLVLIAPVLALSYEYFCIRPESGRASKAIFALLVFFALGMPGTPIYYVFALNSSSAIQNMTTLPFTSILLWVLYILVAVYCLYSVWNNRIMMMNHERDGLVVTKWEGQYSLISVGLLLVCILSIVVTNLLGKVFV